MSVEIWPSIAPEQLRTEEDAAQARELRWLLSTLQTTLRSLKHGLDECYALLAPIDPGSTLVLSTPRNEAVKGTVTRVGTRIVKATINLKLRTLPPQTLHLEPARPIHLSPLTTLNTLLTQSVDLLALCCAADPEPTAPFLSSQLRLLAQHLAEASALLKNPSADSQSPSFFGGPQPHPPPPPPPSLTLTPPSHQHYQQQQQQLLSEHASTAWTTHSASLAHFAPPTSRNISFYLTIQDASLVLYLRALEPADAPLNFGAKLALAIGTARRLDHDEADRLFRYRCDDASRPEGGGGGGVSGSGALSSSSSLSLARPGSSSSSIVSGGGSVRRSRSRSMIGIGEEGGEEQGGEVQRNEVDVYVREKVRVESADPCLLSLSAKLSALANTLALARRNLAMVMGEEDLEDY